MRGWGYRWGFNWGGLDEIKVSAVTTAPRIRDFAAAATLNASIDSAGALPSVRTAAVSTVPKAGIADANTILALEVASIFGELLA